jgi:hypothetical protein
MSQTKTPASLSTAPLEHPALDYDALRREGIRRLEALAGHLWTDFNAHDPGITILEQLCYAITDLAYRASHELPDLLHDPDPAAAPSLYTPAQALSSAPVTLLDLRKLVVDVDGVRNAWVEPVREPQPELFYHEGRHELSLVPVDDTAERVRLRGLYRVMIERSELSWRSGAMVEREVVARLHAHRNLCEDFAEVVVLDPQDVRVHARVEIGGVADAESLLLAIYQRISEHMSPRIRFLGLRAALAAGRRVDELFDGPRLAHGFVDDEALAAAERRAALHTSDLIRVIMATPGVRAVRDISLSSEGGPREPWTLAVGDDRVPRPALVEVDPDAGHTALTITLMRDQLAVAVDEDEVVRRYNAWLTEQGKGAPLAADELDLPLPRGRDRRLADYRSVQHQFPANYGIGDVGLPASAPPERKAEAQQLRAYLTFFDQILALCTAQVAGARRLLAFDPLGQRSYFTQRLVDPSLDYAQVWRGGAPPTADELQAMAEAAVPDGASAERRGRFLDHLLARFGEELTDYSLILFGALRSGADAPLRAGDARARLARDKEAFLRDFPAISRRRGGAIDLGRPADERNSAGLAERLRLKLGLVREDGEDLLLVEHILLRPVREDQGQVADAGLERAPLLAAARYKDPYSLQLSVVLPDGPPRLRHPAFRRFVEQTVREETPAHLTVYVHWVDADRWDGLRAALQRFLDLRRAQFDT